MTITMLDPQNDTRVTFDGNAKPTCRLVRAGEEFLGKQGHLCAPGISAQSAGAQRIHLQIVRIPPGVRSKAHKHEGHESAIYILSGESGCWYGEKLQHHLIARAGDFLYIPTNMPHLPYNLSETESCVAVIARTDPNEQESVVLLPELEKLPDWRARETSLAFGRDKQMTHTTQFRPRSSLSVKTITRGRIRRPFVDATGSPFDPVSDPFFTSADLQGMAADAREASKAGLKRRPSASSMPYGWGPRSTTGRRT